MLSQRARVVGGGRLLVPAEFRRAIGIEVGSTVVVELHDGELRVRPLGSVLRRARDRLASYLPTGSDVGEAGEEPSAPDVPPEIRTPPTRTGAGGPAEDAGR